MQFVTVNGHQMAYREMGSGPVVLFVHGFPYDHSIWLSLMEKLSSTHRVIALDLPGFGQSELFREINRMSEFASDCHDFLKALNVTQPVTFCGQSMGGYIGWEFWHQQPQQVARLVMCGTKVVPDTQQVQQNRREVAQKVLKEGPEFMAATMAEKLFAPQTSQRNPQLLQQTSEIIRGTSSSAIAAAALGMAERENATDWLAEIQCPTLLVCGTEDIISPVEEMQAIAEQIQGSQLQQIPEAGHMAPVEQPGLVADVVGSFLNA